MKSLFVQGKQLEDNNEVEEMGQTMSIKGNSPPMTCANSKLVLN
mgnify:CR=1 FL=1